MNLEESISRQTSNSWSEFDHWQYKEHTMQQESAEQPHAAQHIDQSGMESSFVSNLVVLVISTMLTIVGPHGMAW